MLSDSDEHVADSSFFRFFFMTCYTFTMCFFIFFSYFLCFPFLYGVYLNPWVLDGSSFRIGLASFLAREINLESKKKSAFCWNWKYCNIPNGRHLIRRVRISVKRIFIGNFSSRLRKRIIFCLFSISQNSRVSSPSQIHPHQLVRRDNFQLSEKVHFQGVGLLQYSWKG